MWLAWIALAVALRSASVAELIGIGEESFCSRDWLRTAQLVPPLVAFAALVRLRSTPLALGSFVVLLVGWWAAAAAGDCGYGGDD